MGAGRERLSDRREKIDFLIKNRCKQMNWCIKSGRYRIFLREERKEAQSKLKDPPPPFFFTETYVENTI